MLDIALIILGVGTTIALAFTSHESTHGALRIVFWVCLLATLAIIVYTGLSGMMQSRDLADLKRSVDLRGTKIWSDGTNLLFTTKH